MPDSCYCLLRTVSMKSGIDYRNVAKEIVLILAKYDATYKDVKRILAWLEDEIKIAPIADYTD